MLKNAPQSAAPEIREQYLYGKPTGTFEVVTSTRTVVFRRRRNERKAKVRERAQQWVDGGMQGVPGAPPQARSNRYR